MSECSKFYEIEFDFTIPQCVVVKTETLEEAVEAAMRIAEIYGNKFDNEGIEISNVRLKDKWYWEPPARKDSIGTYDLDKEPLEAQLEFLNKLYERKKNGD